VPWWTWIAILFFVAVVVTGAVVSLLSLRRMRRLQAAGDHVIAALDEVTRKTEELERRTEHANERAELVERKVAHLQASLERLSVLTWALGDAGKTISRMRNTLTLRK
jgi:bifunctional ADP-heptose synthase (sugar kinase/adenylyltransferase)